MLTDICVQLKNIVKVYGKVDKKSGNCRYACDGVDFFASKGSVVVLLGPNGAGKTTLMKIISGVQYQSSGSVSVCGLSDLNDIRKICGYVNEISSLDESLTVKETLYQESCIHGIDKKSVPTYVSRAVKDCQLEDVVAAKVSVLSKGYKQRVCLAKALCFDSKVLVLDEFSEGLDPSQIVSIRKLIKKLARDRVVILSTHHIDEALSLCDCVYIMDKGKICCSGSLDDILRKSGKKSLEDAFLYFTAR